MPVVLFGTAVLPVVLSINIFGGNTWTYFSILRLRKSKLGHRQTVDINSLYLSHYSSEWTEIWHDESGMDGDSSG